MSERVMVGPPASLEDDDVTRFDPAGHSFAIYRLGENAYATDGFCTDEKTHLSDGLLRNCIIECPKHNGRSDIRSRRALNAPAQIDLQTCRVKIDDDGIVHLEIKKPFE